MDRTGVSANSLRRNEFEAICDETGTPIVDITYNKKPIFRVVDIGSDADLTARLADVPKSTITSTGVATLNRMQNEGRTPTRPSAKNILKGKIIR